jgi:hypothetical protein
MGEYLVVGNHLHNEYGSLIVSPPDLPGLDFWNKAATYKQRSPNPSNTGQFGEDVALNHDGSTILIGEIKYDTPETNIGRVLFFDREDDSYSDEFYAYTPEDADDSDYFGATVSIGTGKRIAAAASYEALYTFKWKN